MGDPLATAVFLFGLVGARPAFDPAIDAAREPPQGPSISGGVERLDDTFGFWLSVGGPRLLEDRLNLSLSGGIGWFPDALPAGDGPSNEEPVGPWSPFGHVRLRAELGLRLAESPHRLYVGFGPSAIFPSSELSTTRVGLGLHGGFGLELFAGDRFRTWPLGLVLEIGAVAHLARADARVGEAENAAPLATGLALSVGLRMYPFDG